MTIFNATKPLKSTPFSDFFCNASSREKNKVYRQVLKRATERQQAVMAKAKANRASAEAEA
ncbi:hypothetical protein [Marinagarivorans algicola]|uniref:hypothetical protein n=1 Tax=Marinagarivorans algicola TaxID=1513270 RepID=UPI0006B98F92|nr:hypothetical protein [Marinagarivorans algicola]